MKKYFFAVLSFFTPCIAFAQGEGRWRTLFDNFFELIGRLTILLVGLALALFFFGIVRYFFSPSTLVKEEARKYMFWGVVALFVMTSIWGLTGVLTNFFGFGSVVPQLPTGN